MNGNPLIADLTSQRIEGFEKYKGQHFSIPLFSHLWGNVYIGGCPSARAPAEFKFFLNLFWPLYEISRGQHLFFCQLDDTEELPPEDQLSFLVSQLEIFEQAGPTLIHCQAGLNRSSLIAALWLIRQQGQSPDSAIKRIRTKRSEVCLCNPAFEAYLRAQQ